VNVHEPLGILLGVSPTMFGKVLMLIASFTMPIINAKVVDNVFGTIGYFGLSSITDKFIHGALLTDVVFESVYKCSICLCTTGIRNE